MKKLISFHTSESSPSEGNWSSLIVFAWFKPGDCPICGMHLEKLAPAASIYFVVNIKKYIKINIDLQASQVT